MALYRLVREIDRKEFEENARDNEHALAVFGQRLGKVLSLEGPAAPDFIMARIETNQDHPAWRKPEDIAVFDTGQHSN